MCYTRRMTRRVSAENLESLDYKPTFSSTENTDSFNLKESDPFTVSKLDSRTMSEDHHLDHLDDYHSIDSHRISSSDLPGSPLYYNNPVGFTIEHDSAGESSDRLLPEFPIPPHINHEEHTLHGVHMHTQENAKIPNYNIAVDRSNSTKPVHEWNSLLHADFQDEQFSMAELFLSKESSNRRSRNQQYESVIHNKSAVEETTAVGKPVSTTTDGGESSIKLEALAANVDPTPWSEMKEKTMDVSETAIGSYNYYPYGRHEPLPLPNKVDSPPSVSTTTATAQQEATTANSTDALVKSETIQEAIATAAALAASGEYLDGARAALEATIPPPAGGATTTTTNNQTPAKTVVSKSDVSSSTPAATITASKPPTSSAVKRHFQRISHSPAPQHSQAHSTTRVSMVTAAKQKSQYGFGGNHKVPSVPAPPPVPKKAKYSHTTAPSTVSRTDSSSPPPNGDVAYERKKQRAKDARKLLNESIERLAIAISLAGSQSKQRAVALQSSQSGSGSQGRATILHTMEECVSQADGAKKWDRPSFVGTAASLIQGLNSQCEGLMQELTMLQEKCKASGVAIDTTPAKELGSRQVQEETYSSNLVNRESISARKSLDGEDLTEPLSTESNVPYQNVQVDEEKVLIFKNVAKFLDPISLSRCICVCKEWREMKVFESDEVWFDLAVKRFGVYNVRQWTEKYEDSSSASNGDLITSAPGANHYRIPKKSLYRTMCASMIMPHLSQPEASSQADILLGSAKIPGRICAWVYLVERSNGETLRSVKREPTSSSSSMLPSINSNHQGGGGSYHSLPVVTLRIVFQNIGSIFPVVLKDHHVTVDVSTRRSGGELKEIYWDDRFTKTMKHLDGSVRDRPNKAPSAYDLKGELCSLDLYETVVLDVHIHAKGCSTLSKFQQRSNFCKILVCLNGTTIPLVVPFLREAPVHHPHPLHH